MARKKNPKPRLAQGGIALPLRPPAGLGVSVGVQAGLTTSVPIARQRQLSAHEAAVSCKLFPKGGEAFARWAQAEHGKDPRVRASAAEWLPLLEEFAARPIHGRR